MDSLFFFSPEQDESITITTATKMIDKLPLNGFIVLKLINKY